MLNKRSIKYLQQVFGMNLLNMFFFRLHRIKLVIMI
jgi:hypothetical protein